MTVKMAVGARPATLLRLNLNKKKVSYFSGISKVLGLCLPIIYNRMKGENMTFLFLLIGACLVGFLGAEGLQ